MHPAAADAILPGMVLRRNSLWPVVVIVGVAQFTLVWIWAASVYPGGSDLDVAAEDHDFFRNTITDLGQQQSDSGKPNPAADVFNFSSLVLLVAVSATLWVLPRTYPHRPATARWARLTGLLAVAALVVAVLQPGDSAPTGHMTAIGVSAAFGIGTAALLYAASAGAINDPLRWLTGGLALAVCVNTGLYVHSYLLGGPWTVVHVFAEKLLALLVCAWCITGAVSVKAE